MTAFQNSGWDELSKVLDAFGPDLCDERWIRQHQDPELPNRGYDLLSDFGASPRQDRDGRMRQLADLVRSGRVELPKPEEPEEDEGPSPAVGASAGEAAQQPSPASAPTATPPARPASAQPVQPAPQPVTSPPARKPTPPVAPPPTDRTAPPRPSPTRQAPARAGQDEAAAAQAAALRRASDRGDPVVEIQYQPPTTGSGRSTS